MIHIQSKGKGILVLVYGFVPIFVSLILTSIVNEYCFDKKLPEGAFQIISSVAVLISGFWTYKTSDDFYIDDNGEKQFIYFEHKFMFLNMKIWAYIFWVIGASTLIGGVIDLI